MKTLIPILALAACLLAGVSRSCFAQQSASAAHTALAGHSIGTTSSVGAYQLTVVLSGVNKRSGKLYVGLANNAETFEKESLRNKVIDVPASGEIAITFDSLTAGQYAVRVYQDLNDNQKIDFSGMMPTEPFGFSNVTMVMGPPEFGQCAFDLNKDKRITITMINM